MKAARAVWFEKFADVRVNQLVFLDEFGATTTMQRTHGRAAPGERVVSKVPHAHWKTISSIAAMGVTGIIAAVSFDGPTNTEVFIKFIRESLVPVLKPGQVVVMDNLQAHKNPQVDELVEAAGARVLRLPAYSPDYNPIEMAISKIKSVLKKLSRRSVVGLFKGIAEALQAISLTDAMHYIEHCGYATKRRSPL